LPTKSDLVLMQQGFGSADKPDRSAIIGQIGTRTEMICIIAVVLKGAIIAFATTGLVCRALTDLRMTTE
jgi:hypothetical protein